jgi:hypothetical protein
MEDETFLTIGPLGADSHDFLYKVSKLAHDEFVQYNQCVPEKQTFIKETWPARWEEMGGWERDQGWEF